MRRQVSFAFAGAGKHHHKFVAANSGCLVDRANDRFDPLAHLFQDDVTRLMAKRIVHVLEVVHIDQYQTDILSVFARASKAALSSSPIKAVRFHKSVRVSRCAISSILRYA